MLVEHKKMMTMTTGKTKMTELVLGSLDVSEELFEGLQAVATSLLFSRSPSHPHLVLHLLSHRPLLDLHHFLLLSFVSHELHVAFVSSIHVQAFALRCASS